MLGMTNTIEKNEFVKQADKKSPVWLFTYLYTGRDFYKVFTNYADKLYVEL